MNRLVCVETRGGSQSGPGGQLCIIVERVAGSCREDVSVPRAIIVQTFATSDGGSRCTVRLQFKEWIGHSQHKSRPETKSSESFFVQQMDRSLNPNCRHVRPGSTRTSVPIDSIREGIRCRLQETSWIHLRGVTVGGKRSVIGDNARTATCSLNSAE
jgi:hypothetical protein